MAVVQVSIERPNGNSNSSRCCNAKDCDRSCLTRCPTGSRGFAHTVLCGQRGRRGRHFPVNVRAGLGQIEYARTRLVRSAAGLDKKVNRSLRKPGDYVPAVSVSCSLTNYVTGTVLGRYRQPGDGLILRITCDPADRRGKSRCGYRHAQHGHQRDLAVCLHRMSLFTKLVQHVGWSCESVCAHGSAPRGLGGTEANSSPFWPSPPISLLRPGTSSIPSSRVSTSCIAVSLDWPYFLSISRVGLGCCVPLEQVPRRFEQGRVVHHIEEPAPTVLAPRALRPVDSALLVHVAEYRVVMIARYGDSYLCVIAICTRSSGQGEFDIFPFARGRYLNGSRCAKGVVPTIDLV